MMDATRQTIERARRLVLLPDADLGTAADFIRAVVDLAGMRPNKIDLERVERGEFCRMGGDAECPVCSHVLYDHPVVPGFEFLRRRCDGEFVKL